MWLWCTYPILAESDGLDYGIAGLGTGPSREAWNLVDVLVDVQHRDNQQPMLRLMLGEVPWKGAVKQSAQSGGSRFVLEGVPADGALLQVFLGGDTYAHGQASMRLPSRVPIRVFVDPAGDDLALSQVLAADGAFEISASENTADVALLWSKSATSALPALRFPSADEQEAAILLQHEEALESEDVLRHALGEFGLDRIDATEMANRAARPIELSAQTGPRRELSIWRELLDAERFGLVESRAFPLLISRGLKWLAQVPTLHAYVAVGNPLPVPIGTGGAAFVGDVLPTRTGEFSSPSGEPLSASVLQVTPGSSWQGPQPQLATSLGRSLGDPLFWVLVLLLTVVFLEWVLFSTGRMP